MQQRNVITGAELVTGGVSTVVLANRAWITGAPGSYEHGEAHLTRLTVRLLKRARSSPAYYTLRDCSRLARDSAQQSNLPVVITLVKAGFYKSVFCLSGCF